MRGVTIVTNDGYTGELISTRTPHAGSDPMRPVVSVTNSFQPALPMRGSDGYQNACLFKFVLIYPHSPRQLESMKLYRKFRASRSSREKYWF